MIEQDRKPRRFETLRDACEFADLHRDRWGFENAWAYRDAGGREVGAGSRWFTMRGETGLSFIRHSDGWAVGGMPSPRPLFRLPELLAADPSERVLVLKNEWRAEIFSGTKLPATTCAGGFKEADATDWEPLRGRTIWICGKDREAKQLAKYLRERIGGDIQTEPFKAREDAQ